MIEQSKTIKAGSWRIMVASHVGEPNGIIVTLPQLPAQQLKAAAGDGHLCLSLARPIPVAANKKRGGTMACKICGKSDLFSEVTGEPACSICKIYFVGGMNGAERVDQVREKLGLKEGEFLKIDHGKEAARILGR